MLHYQLSIEKPLEHFISFNGSFYSENSIIQLQLATWRPGRYELMNYAKNIRFFKAFDKNGNELICKKISKDCWEIETTPNSHIYFQYEYYAFEMDAGNSFFDENQLYVNFINCIPSLVGRENEAIQIILDIPSNYKIACGLEEIEEHLLVADNYAELIDSPMFASASLQEKTYEIGNTIFHIWIQGKYTANWNKIIDDFKKFSIETINLFGDFPCCDYHFLIQILPYRYYHGVEHRNSTVIALGQDQENPIDFYDDLLGVSCHELFHTWNVCRIRPKEMMPYDYTKENYFETGFIAEGVTTYYGDYLLARSHVFTTEQYFKELNTLLQRHFHNYGRFNASLAESSFDLWLDGYQQGIPNRKVSIYVKGALIALLLDLMIRKETNNEKSLDNIMKVMWLQLGKNRKGYTIEHYKNYIMQIFDSSFAKGYIQDYVFGTIPLENVLNESLNYIGCELTITPNPVLHERLGFKVIKQKVYQIAPNSPVISLLSVKDEIIHLDEKEDFCEITIKRNCEEKIVMLPIDSSSNFYPIHQINKKSTATHEEKENFKCWLNQSF